MMPNDTNETRTHQGTERDDGNEGSSKVTCTSGARMLMSSSGIVAVVEVGEGYREIFTVLRSRAELFGPSVRDLRSGSRHASQGFL